MLSTLPFDLCLIDPLQLLPEAAQEMLVAIAKQRGAGLLFAAARPQIGRRFAEARVVLRDGALNCEAAR